MRGDEARVVQSFCAWLTDHGWDVSTEVDFCDVVARRAEETLYAEAKGRTAAIGLDVDTMYGQLLRRMPMTSDPSARYAVVVPTEARSHALRVPAAVRASLRIDVYVVAQDGTVDAVITT
ncbi:hypothetical protein [uncultured Cellulomonas sp.]|uniref:hypothetical protein n=1 Tax=uncultured Cellulomonas sp. TaxID=189682 RepID=UPI00260D71D0|nr:hypothetical protein [uncultured Cellulomonas sp.]